MNATAIASPVPTVFSFDPCQIRVITIDGEPWFVAKDVAEALDYVWKGASGNLKHVPEQWKGVRSVQTPSGDQDMSILSEQGLYFFLGRSDKPKALPLQMYVAGEVLPAIRKTGRYIATPAEPTGPVDRYIDLTTHPDIRYLVQQLEVRFWFGHSASHATWAALRKIGGARATAFPESQVPRALEEIRRIAMRAEQFFRIKCNFEEAGIQWVFGTDAEILHRPELPPIGEQLRLP